MTDENSNNWSIPILNSENHDSWFRRYRVMLPGKGVFYVVEQTMKNVCMNVTESTNHPKASERAGEDIYSIRASFDEEKQKKYLRDEATAIDLMFRSLSSDDQALYDEYTTSFSLWAYLGEKYKKSDPTTADEYMTEIQTFKLENRTIIEAWDKLKDFRRKLCAADETAKNTYRDKALLLILIRALPRDYTATIDTLNAQSHLTVDERLKRLQLKESRLLAESKEESAFSGSHQGRKSPRSRAYDHRDSNESGFSPVCYLCDIRHFVKACPYMDIAREAVQEYIRTDKLEREKRKKGSFNRPSSLRARSPSPHKPTKRVDFKGKAKAFDAALHSNSDSDIDDDAELYEHAQLSRALISKASSSTWASDTGASAYMSDQPSLFRSLITIPRRTILVGGGKLYARAEGSAQLTCKDGSSMMLHNVLLVPGLGINLLSGRQMCRNGGLKGAFDENHLYFKRGDRPLITATMKNGLYIVSHVSNGNKCSEIPAYNARSEDMEVDNDESKPVIDAELTPNEKDRYMLYHRRFSHLGPQKLRTLHKVTNLSRPIKVPQSLEERICEVCLLTKMRNKTSKELAKWKTEKLALIHVDIAGPFPPSLRKNRWFILILDSFTRKLWVLCCKTKDEALTALDQWKLGVEFQSGEKIKAVRSDNAAELLKVVSKWKVEQ
ncbi:hypothetical protein K3495_g14554, partial [Podosphaera aphanis]